MTLDPVHFEGIADLFGDIDSDADEEDHREFATTAFEEFLDPLYDDGRPILEPIGELARRRIDVEDVALADDPFPITHGLDSGTLTPVTFKNGFVVDVAHAAMGVAPSDLDAHRARTIVAAIHTNERSLGLGGDWETFDDGYGRRRRIQAPVVERYEEAVVHGLALYHAESEHALEHADAVSDLLLLDGPLYPKGVLQWIDRRPELADLFADSEALRTVVRNYTRLVERFVEREVPLAGFVKNVSSKGVVRAIGRKRGETGRSAPWAHDAAFFSQVLERREDGPDGSERETDALTFTNWFVSRVGTDRFFGASSTELDLDRRLDPELYEVACCAIYDPRTDLLYKVETPCAFAREERTRERIERQVLKDVAVQRGPPLAVAKADELARIGRTERRSLCDRLEAAFDSEIDDDYDAERWA